MIGKKHSETFLSMHCSLGIIERVSSKLLLSFCYPSFIHDNISLILVYSCLEVNLPDQPNRRIWIRTYSGVGGTLSDGRSYPDIRSLPLVEIVPDAL